jgi:hypothetical protein
VILHFEWGAASAVADIVAAAEVCRRAEAVALPVWEEVGGHDFCCTSFALPPSHPQSPPSCQKSRNRVLHINFHPEQR